MRDVAHLRIIDDQLWEAAKRRHKAQTEQLAKALKHSNEELRASARSTLRHLVDAIIIPRDGQLEVRGNLGAMLTAASGQDGSALAGVGTSGC